MITDEIKREIDESMKRFSFKFIQFGSRKKHMFYLFLQDINGYKYRIPYPDLIGKKKRVSV